MLHNQTVLALAAAVAMGTPARAGTIFVDDDCPGPGDGSQLDPYCSIQTAIDNAVDTDEIVVAPGTYVEAVNFIGKAITLRSSGGPDVTIIDGTGNLHVVQCASGEGPDTVLQGFTITGGNAGAGKFPDNSGGGMLNFLSNPTVTNCTFTNNSAAFGGGMLSFGDAVVANCTFTGNSASTGGGMYNFQTSPTVTNCTFSGNLPDEFVDSVGALSVVSFSDVQGGLPGMNNIDADPLFADPKTGDLRLQPGSPCIDAGDNTAVPASITTDLDGNPRFLDVPETPDTGNSPGGGPIVDMGAYESLGGGCLAVTSQEVVCHADGTTFTVNVEGLNACTGGTTQVTFTGSGGAVGEQLCFTALISDGGFCCSTEICVTIPDCSDAVLPGDLDGDGVVGGTDFLTVLSAWGLCGDCGECPADFDGDCSVGASDLMVLLANWG